MKRILLTLVCGLLVLSSFSQTRKELHKKIDSLWESQDFVNLEDVLEKLISQKKRSIYHVSYYSYLAYTQYKLDKPLEALESINRAIVLAPRNLNNYKARGFLYYRAEALELAKKDFEKVLKMRELDAYSLRYLGRIHEQQEDYNMARVYYARLFASDPANLNSELNLVRLMKKQGDYEYALSDLNRLIAKHPENSVLHNNRGDLFMLMNRLDEAMEDVNIALEIKPDYATALVTKGEIFLKLGDHEQACSFFEKALSNGFQRQRIAEYMKNCEKVDSAD